MKQYEKAAIERLNREYWRTRRDIYSVYANPSKAKCDIWQDILDCAIRLGGDATVVTYNSQVFTAAIFWRDPQSELPYGVYITRGHRVTVNMFNNTIIESV